MRIPAIAALSLGVLLTAALAVASWGGREAGDPREAEIVFVCQNGVAMSVWSASYFNRLASERGLRERAVSRASTPSFRDVPLRMVLALALEGYRLHGYRPRVIDAEDANRARLVVMIDTGLPAEARVDDLTTEIWSGFPPMREQYFPSRAALKERVESLVERLAAAQRAGSAPGASHAIAPISPP